MAKKRNQYVLSITMGLFCLLWFMPVIFLILTSLRPVNEIQANPFGIPRHLSFDAFSRVWSTGQMELYFLNSLLVVTTSLVLLIALASLAGFGLGRRPYNGQRTFSTIFLIGLLIPGQVTLVPLFSLFSQLGLINSYLPLVLLNVAFGLPFSVLVFSQFFRQVSLDIEDAAEIDGCTKLGFFIRVLMPLSGTAIATVAVLQFMWMWNDLLFALTFIHRDSMRTVPLGLLGLKGRFVMEFDTVSAGALLSVLPILLIYVVFHRHLIKGIAGGN